MIARNIAPWLQRYFAFEHFPIYDEAIFKTIRSEAKESKYDKTYTIIWSDVDEEVLEIAKENATHMWVADTISFVYGDILDHEQWKTSLSDSELTMITNPPYGKRMDDNVSEIHHILSNITSKKSIILTGYEWSKNLFSDGNRSWKVTKNGADETNIFLSK